MIHLLVPVSSAGVPMRMSVPGTERAFIVAATPTAEARDDVAIRLCPQAWPICGRASAGVSDLPQV